MATHGAAVGIELDTHSIRAVKVKAAGSGKKGLPVIAAIEEIDGNFVKDEEVIDGLKAIRHRMSLSPFDTVVTCVGGKQTYVAQMPFKKLPDDEMKNALKFEIRKNLPFDTAGASIEFQFLGQGGKKNDVVPVIVTAVSNILLQRFLRVFEKAGMAPSVIDVFPLTLANTYAVWSEKHAGADTNAVLLHIGYDSSTLVVDGAAIPFFNRTIYFSAGELFGPSRNEDIAQREIDRRVASFTEEIVRSLAYYETTHHAKASATLSVAGNFNAPDLLQKIGQDTGLSVTMLDLVKTVDEKRETIPGKFDIALTLGMRG